MGFKFPREIPPKIVHEALKALGVLVLLLVLMMWLSGVFHKKIQPGPPIEKNGPAALKTWKAQKAAYPLILEHAGSVRARLEAQIASRITAQVKEVLAREGDVIAGGDGASTPTLLAILDDREIKARLRQAETQLSAAERGIETARARLASTRAQTESARANSVKASSDFHRIRNLADQSVATPQQLDHIRAQKEVSDAQLKAVSEDAQAAKSEIERMEAQRETARAAMEEVKTMLTYTRIHAPFSGRLIKKLTNAGDMALPGQSLFLVETSLQPEFHASIPESLLVYLHRGQQLEVEIDALHRSFTGVLREIVPQSDPGTRTFLVKIGLSPDPQLVNGLFGRLRVPHGEYHALSVPGEAVQETGQLYFLYVLDGDGHSRRRFVTLGRRHESTVEILSGLSEGEEVVVP